MLNRAVSVCALLLLLLPIVSEASEGVFRPLAMQVRAQDQLVVSGFHGSVTLIGDDSQKSLSVQLKQVAPKQLPEELKDVTDEWLFSLKRDGDQILATVGSPVSKAAWMKYINSTSYQPEFHLIVRSPSIPVTLSWRTGPIKIEGWQNSIELNTLNANTTVKNTKGVLNLMQQQGSLSILEHEGLVNLDTYKVRSQINKVVGPLNVDSFGGVVKVISSEGKVVINSYSGQFEVNQGKGAIDFQSDRGKMIITGHEGDLNSETDLGSVRAVLVGKSRVKIKTKQGNVSLRMPNSGANVNLGTENGNLNVPNYLRFTRLPNLRLMTGRLRGKNSGRVYVRTESGEIRLR